MRRTVGEENKKRERRMRREGRKAGKKTRVE
jgi:hypothetical protein